MKCIYLNSPRFLENNSCKYTCKYGNYCYKHRRFYLLDYGIINIEKFTYKKKDYTKNDLQNTLSILYPFKLWNEKKDVLYDELLKHISLLNNNKIVKLQANIRRYLVQRNLIRGIGYFKKDICTNTEDFYYMTTSTEIENKYFFSYTDSKKNTWFFDIRSFKRLIDENQLNPYTREDISFTIKTNATIILSRLIAKQISVEIEEFTNIDRRAIIKQKTVDLCSNLSEYGYYCDINWFLSLGRHKLKNLYKSLEDIWNYRAYLTEDVKSRISPPNGLVFTYPLHEIRQITNKNDLREIILNEVFKFNNAVSIEDRKLGYMYFLIGLSEINIDCLNSHEWVQYALH